MYFHISNNATILLAGWQTSTPLRKCFTQFCWCVTVTYNWIVYWLDSVETFWHCVVLLDYCVALHLHGTLYWVILLPVCCIWAFYSRAAGCLFVLSFIIVHHMGLGNPLPYPFTSPPSTIFFVSFAFPFSLCYSHLFSCFSISFHSTRIVPLHFQAGCRKRRLNLALVFIGWFYSICIF